MTTNTQTLVSAFTLKAIGDAGKAFVSATKHGDSLSKRMTILADGLISDGYESKDVKAKGHEELRAFLKDQVTLCFSKAAQQMIATGAKALKSIGDEKAKENRDTICKENCKVWQQQQGSYLAKISAAMLATEKANRDALAGEKAEEGKSSLDAKLAEILATWIKRLEKNPATGFDCPKMLDALKAAKVLIK